MIFNTQVTKLCLKFSPTTRLIKPAKTNKSLILKIIVGSLYGFSAQR